MFPKESRRLTSFPTSLKIRRIYILKEHGSRDIYNDIAEEIIALKDTLKTPEREKMSLYVSFFASVSANVLANLT